jgi:hypothetical protein
MDAWQRAHDFEKRQNESALKYIYFLLGLTGAGIGFVVQKLDGQRFDLAGTLLLIGAATWLLSLLLGICSLEQEVKMKGINTEIAHYLAEVEAAKKGVHEGHLAGLHQAYGTHAGKAHKHLKWQFRTLIFGAALVISWRVVEMACRQAQ